MDADELFTGLRAQKLCAVLQRGFNCRVSNRLRTILNLQDIANELSKRLISPFQPDEKGHRPVNDYFTIYRDDPNFKNLVYSTNIFMAIHQEVSVLRIKLDGRAW
jgi:hypothetical protein